MGVVTKGGGPGKFVQQSGVRRVTIFGVYRTIKIVAFASHLELNPG